MLDHVLLVSAAFKLGFAFAAVAMLMATLRLFDYVCGITFGEIMAELRQNDGIAIAIYFGARILAVALLIAGALG